MIIEPDGLFEHRFSANSTIKLKWDATLATAADNNLQIHTNNMLYSDAVGCGKIQLV
jgi:hypothetical protein